MPPDQQLIIQALRQQREAALDLAAYNAAQLSETQAALKAAEDKLKAMETDAGA